MRENDFDETMTLLYNTFLSETGVPDDRASAKQYLSWVEAAGGRIEGPLDVDSEKDDDQVAVVGLPLFKSMTARQGQTLFDLLRSRSAPPSEPRPCLPGP